MTQEKLQAKADEIASDLVSGRFQKHALRFAFPVVAYFGDNIMVLNEPDQLVTALALYRSILSEEWLSLITSTVTDCGCDKNGSCKVSVRNRFFATDGRDLGTARINYYGEVSGADHRIRTVEYLDWPRPDRIAECLPLQPMMG